MFARANEMRKCRGSAFLALDEENMRKTGEAETEIKMTNDK
jgi:hypothetical protein